MKKILIIGDICQDVYYFSNKTKLNPESSQPAYVIDKIITKSGMAGNVAANLSSVSDTTLLANSKPPHIQKIRLFYNNEYMQRIDIDQYEKLHDEPEFGKNIDIQCLDNDAVIISDYGKGSYNLVSSFWLGIPEIPVFVDPSPLTSIEAYLNCTVITPNYKEGCEMTGKTDKYEICKKLFEDVQCSYVVLKLGENGAILFNGTSFKEFPAIPTTVVDVCGAGDTFISALAYFYLEGYNIQKCVEAANLAASITVSHLGVYALTEDDWNKIEEKINETKIY